MTEHSGDRPTVLIAEDERDLADLFAKWLEPTYEVYLAYDGDEAIERFDDGIDVVLLDRNMPTTSGDEVLRFIRARESECLVAMLTAIEPDVDIFELGFDEYIVKPVQDDELRSLVERLLRRRGFDDDLRRHYQITSKLAVLEEHVPASELSKRQEYQDLLDELELLDGALTKSTGTLDAADVGAILRGEIQER